MRTPSFPCFRRPRLLAGLLLLLPLGSVAGCVSLEQLNPTMGQSMPPYFGRAYFLKKTPFGSAVLVCDVQPNNSGLVCYNSGSAGSATP